MKIKTHELAGRQLDWAVATAEINAGHYTTDENNYSLPLLQLDAGWFASKYGQSVFGPGDGIWRNHKPSPNGRFQARGNSLGSFQPSTDWAWGGPIIEREGIETAPRYAGDGKTVTGWTAMMFNDERNPRPLIVQHGDTPLVAAMRCIVLAELGEEVELPEGLKND